MNQAVAACLWFVVEVTAPKVQGFVGKVDPGDVVAVFVGRRTRAGTFAVPAVRNLTNNCVFGARQLVNSGQASVPPDHLAPSAAPVSPAVTQRSPKPAAAAAGAVADVEAGQVHRSQEHEIGVGAQRPSRPYKDRTRVRTFTLEHIDETGVVHRTAVEVSTPKEHGFAGVLDDGDHVVFYVHSRVPGRAVIARAMSNRTNGSVFGDWRLVEKGKAQLPN
jgi:hypothetical protein